MGCAKNIIATTITRCTHKTVFPAIILAVSHDGTHLGHNLPDAMGNRYCINLVSVAGRSLDDKEVD